MALKPGDTLFNGQYSIVRLLGRGGFGFVYLAHDTLLAEEVAVKELIPALVGDEAMLKRFLAEAKATMRLAHPRIVHTRNLFSEAGNYYIIMEHMAGGSLEARLQEGGPLPMAEAIRAMAQVCEGLSFAHEQGVVHCDLKPANILFDAQGQAKVGDFGIAHVSDQMLSRSWHTPAGFVAGTLPYMSPEQTDGVRDDPRVDVYALGAILYRMVTGRTYVEFDRRDTPRASAENVRLICEQPPPPPSVYNRRVPAWVDAIALKALAKQPEERYTSVGDLRAALLSGGALAVPVAPPSRPSVAPVPRQQQSAAAGRQALPPLFWPLAGGAAALLVILAVVLVVGLGGGGDGGPTALPTVPTLTPAPTRVPETPVPTLAPATPETPSTVGATKTRSSDGMAMVAVPAGEFAMGSPAGEGGDNEHPQHDVTLDAFWIDKAEVTNAQYQKCVAAGACSASAYAGASSMNAPQQPVVGVNRPEAKAYCEWAGARLPTEAEWEKAARGTDGRIYPWGNDAPYCGVAQYNGCGGSVPVGSKPAGASPYGALDMAGNVWEWVADWYGGDYYAGSPARNPQGPDSGEFGVLRGGGWNHNPSYLRGAFRMPHNPDYRNIDIGFRCVVLPEG